jgi:hypothetical protein
MSWGVAQVALNVSRFIIRPSWHRSSHITDLCDTEAGKMTDGRPSVHVLRVHMVTAGFIRADLRRLFTTNYKMDTTHYHVSVAHNRRTWATPCASAASRGRAGETLPRG